MITVLSALPEANFLPSFAYATQCTTSLCPLNELTTFPSSGSYTTTLSPAPTTSWSPSGWKQIEWMLKENESCNELGTIHRFIDLGTPYLATSFFSFASWIFSTHFGMALISIDVVLYHRSVPHLTMFQPEMIHFLLSLTCFKAGPQQTHNLPLRVRQFHKFYCYFGDSRAVHLYLCGFHCYPSLNERLGMNERIYSHLYRICLQFLPDVCESESRFFTTTSMTSMEFAWPLSFIRETRWVLMCLEHEL